MAYTFKGGIHPDDSKQATEHKPIKKANAPKLAIIPLSQHIGAPCEAIVAVGDTVKMGQKIGDSKAAVSVPVHASVSGVVKEIKLIDHPGGSKGMAVIIENDFQDTLIDLSTVLRKPLDEMMPQEFMDMIREGGSVGMGGATFPTHIKISSGLGKVDTLIINGAECEPYLTADHRELLEMPDDVLGGADILRRCFGLKKTIIAIEENKQDAITLLKEKAPKDGSIEIAVLKTKYPQGGEKQLIQAVAGCYVPGGKLPADVGCAVFNIDTTASIYRIYTTGMPVISRVLTCTGSAISAPQNLLVRIGTPFHEVIEQCGGFVREPVKVLMGGPMMGVAQWTLDVPVIKGTSGILAFDKQTWDEPAEAICISCGRCISACPVNLVPTHIYLYANKGKIEECEKLNVGDCIECGSCSFICPGRLHLVQTFRATKLRVAEEKRKAQLASQAGAASAQGGAKS